MKRRRVFDDGATIVEEVKIEKSEGTKQDKPQRAKRNKSIKVVDVMDTFWGYLIPRINKTKQDEGGECILCGKQTSTSHRKICFECMQEHGENLYTKAREAVENNVDKFFL